MQTTATTEQTILRAGAYKAIISPRTDLTRYPNCLYEARRIQETPKAKYFKEKVLKHYVYKTEAEALESSKKWIDTIQGNIDSNAAHKAERAAKDAEVKAADFYKVGDIIVNTWGWEQTNVDFYQVAKVGNKTIEIRAISSQVEEGSEYSHGMACNVLPVIDGFIESASGYKTYKLRVKAEGTLSNPASYYYMHKWDGRPMYRSWYA